MFVRFHFAIFECVRARQNRKINKKIFVDDIIMDLFVVFRCCSFLWPFGRPTICTHARAFLKNQNENIKAFSRRLETFIFMQRHRAASRSGNFLIFWMFESRPRTENGQVWYRSLFMLCRCRRVLGVRAWSILCPTF